MRDWVRKYLFGLRLRSKKTINIPKKSECDIIRNEWRCGEMVSQKVVIKNPTGLHLRPAGILCKEAMQFKSLITFSFRETTANAKSVLSVLGACVKCGDEIEVVCDGEDEKDALEALIVAIENGLGE